MSTLLQRLAERSLPRVLEAALEWTMEQIGRIKSYGVRLTPYANVINMRKFTGITSDRKLHKLQELDDNEYKRRLLQASIRIRTCKSTYIYMYM